MKVTYRNARRETKVGQSFRLGTKNLSLGEKTRIVGILNVTPDSFSDGGEFNSFESALSRAKEIAEEGADIIDVGGESTRPGFEALTVEEELSRVIPIIESISTLESFPPVSIDTTKHEVARAALESGARIVNDIWGFRRDQEMANVVAEWGASCVLMHNSRSGWLKESVLESIKFCWDESITTAIAAGVEESRIILDPGIGFTDTRKQDLSILRGLKELRAFGFPILLGASRKRITGVPMDLSLEKRLETTLAITALGVESGVDFVRVHDIKENVRAARMADMIVRG